MKKKDDLTRFIEEQCAKDPEFKAAYEAESALFTLIRARQEANLSQQDVADKLNVSQPYIAQIEKGTRKPGYLLLFRYANAVGASIQVTRGNAGPA